MTDNVMGYWDAMMNHARRVDRTPAPQSFSDRYPAEFAWIQSSTFDFAIKMREVLRQYPGLTAGQLAAVQRCMNYQPKPAPTPVAPAGISLSNVPTGMYAVPGGDTRLKVRIDQGDGKWQGYVFVKDGAEYGSGRRYGMQRPGQTYVGQIQDQLAIIAQDPRAAAAAYGRLVGSCGLCGRRLEDPDSVARGIGPVCAAKHGW